MYLLAYDAIEKALKSSGYISSPAITGSLFASFAAGKPLLIEGAPGVGKTSIASALAEGLGLPLIRVQCYEGLTEDKLLYDFDYQKQLLVIESIRPTLEEKYRRLSVTDAIKAAAKEADFYGEDFMLDRPVLRTIRTKGRKVLLIDEIDKAPEEIEYMLYEFLEDFHITIPQYGEMRCAEEDRPYVFLTSNRYRELSGALKRRCAYMYIEEKSREELISILMQKTSASQDLADCIARCLIEMRKENLYYMPSVSEAIDFAGFIASVPNITKELVLSSLGNLSKDSRDRQKICSIVSANGEILWTEK